MADQIVYVDRFKLREGKQEAFERYATDMADFVEANESDVGFFNYYLDEDGKSGAAVFVFSDAAALDKHLELAAHKFQEGVDLLESADIMLLGPASDQAAEMTRSYGGTTADKVAGFSR